MGRSWFRNFGRSNGDEFDRLSRGFREFGIGRPVIIISEEDLLINRKVAVTGVETTTSETDSHGLQDVVRPFTFKCYFVGLRNIKVREHTFELPLKPPTAQSLMPTYSERNVQLQHREFVQIKFVRMAIANKRQS